MSVEQRPLSRAGAAIASAGLLWACLSVRDEARREQNSCASCHGDAARDGDALAASAPPRDLMGNNTADYPGVGAHQAHLAASGVHAGVACAECHALPDAVDSPGHADSALPAELHFGPLATSGGRAPRYDALARRCSDTYCHGALSPIWTEPAGAPCAGCHGRPPPPPHPQSERCVACHGEVVDAEQQIIDAARHVDGRVDLALDCDGCHGSAHSPAPPPSLAGDVSADQRGVGAHQAHLGGGAGSRPVACAECHEVPTATPPFVHPDGRAASVVFAGAARAGDREPAWDAQAGACSDTWCHDPSERASAAVGWTHGAALPCTQCHGLPPAAPHPQVQDCGLCHADVYASADAAIRVRERHVDGLVDVRVSGACDSCHGSAGSDGGASGPTPGSAPDLGAHAVHLAPRGAARPVLCEECHRVPSTMFAEGHLDSLLPAEVRFSGVAQAFEASPVFAAGSCTQTYCHGDQFIGGRPSGGVDTRPSWTTPGDASSLTCESCHGMPPPAPHPAPADDCSGCHRNVDASQGFVAPETHIDGVVTFFLQ